MGKKSHPVLHGLEEVSWQCQDVQLGQEVSIVEKGLIVGQNGCSRLERPVEVLDSVWRCPQRNIDVMLGSGAGNCHRNAGQIACRARRLHLCVRFVIRESPSLTKNVTVLCLQLRGAPQLCCLACYE